MDYVNGRQCKTYIRRDENGKLLLDAWLYERDRGPIKPLLDRVKETFDGKEKTPVTKYKITDRKLTIDTSEMREKLANLSQHMEDRSGSFLQGMDSSVYEFGRLLSQRLKSHSGLVPAGFLMAAELLIYDLQRGVDGFSKEPIESPLTGMPPTVYDGLRLYLPEIAKAVAPSEFAEAVKEGQEEILRKSKGLDKV